MIARSFQKLPWYLPAPAFVTVAIVLAVGLNLLAGNYFQRTVRDDADPLAGLAAPAAHRTAAAASGGNPVPTAASQGAAAATAGSDAAAGAAAPPPPAAGVLAQGRFIDGDPGHNGEGTARLIRGPDGALTLRFEDFSVTNGPDLFVILGTDPAGSRASAAAADALNLGRLKATDGNVNYAVPDGTDTTRFRSVIIYCRAFRVVFAVATLE
jgi:hypothetical protein